MNPAPPSFNSGLRVRPPGGLAAGFTYSYRPPAPPVAANPAVDSGVNKCAPGPWGDIEYSYIYLEASEQTVAQFPMPSSTTVWRFPGANVDYVRALFENARIPQAWMDEWLSVPSLSNTAEGISITPRAEHIEALMQEQRSYLYAELAKHPENAFHADPMFITSGSAEEFLRNTGIAPALVRLFAKMCYYRGKVLCFSDVNTMLLAAQSDKEAVRLAKLCTRTRAIIARLRLSENTNFEALLDYWTCGERRRDMMPLLRSLGEQRQSVDLIHLLPPIGRRLLNSYPSMDLAYHGRMPDCHWTSLNFFNQAPRNFYLDTRLAANHVLNAYQQIERPYRYGDKLLFLNAEGNCFHSCVYIAADLVFTKNGDNIANPWVLCHLSDLEQIYSSVAGGRVQGFRMEPGEHR